MADFFLKSASQAEDGITYSEAGSDLFSSGADALVNPVNTVGVMGKGLALSFKKRFPENFRFYANYCQQGLLSAGEVYAYFGDGIKSPIILNAATKGHWKNPSRLEYVESCLVNIRGILLDKIQPIRSIAVPALGCGEGGLAWEDVRPLIEQHLGGLTISVLVYKPLTSGKQKK